MDLFGKKSPIVLISHFAMAYAALTITQTSDAQTVNSPAAASSNSGTTLYEEIARFGGPRSVGGQLAEDNDVNTQRFRLQRLQDQFEPWYQFKRRIHREIGLQFEVDESILFQAASRSLGEEDAASGLVRVFGQWELLRRGSDHPGFLVFKVEHRHKVGSGITPFDLGFEAGSVVPTGTNFNEFSFAATNLFWKQYPRNLVAH